MRLKYILLSLTTLFFSLELMAQGKITGRVFDNKSGEPIEYATVAVLNIRDSSLVTGAVSQPNGSFEVKVAYGKYLVRISFMGYSTYFHPQFVTLNEKQGKVNLGKVRISPSATMMQEVNVMAERTMVEYQLDKRVVNVDKNLVSSGGTATDVLQQVPSVSVDNDGNVTLRGSTNVKVLIDGRPYELMGSDLETLLEQIPASTVENVEIITNPSAKYDPEGMSGIINIKLKDKSTGALGLNGVANLNFGAPLPFMIPEEMPSFIPTAMGNISLNYTTEKYNLFFSADGGQRSRGHYGVTEIAHRNSGVDYTYDSIREYHLNPGLMGSIKIGGEYYFNKNNSLLLSYQLRGGNRRRNGTIYGKDLMYNGSMDYEQSSTSDNHNVNHSVNLLYTRKMSHKDEELTFDATFSTRHVKGNGQQEQVFFGDALWDNYYKRESFTENRHQALNAKLNWQRPFDNGWKLETGYEGRMDWPDQEANYYRYVYLPDHTIYSYFDSLSSTHFNYRLHVHSVYATYGGNFGEKLSALFGIRGEYSKTYGKDVNHPASTPVNKPYLKIYPTVHLSYAINDMQSIQMSYSRRVRRPHMWDLNPYVNVMEGQHLGFGNPNLDPEFTNAFELSYNLTLKKVNLYTSAYFRHSNNVITWYGFVWDSLAVSRYAWWEPYSSQFDGYWASAPQNLSNSYNYGLEFIVDWQIFKWWKVNVSLNLFNERIEGTDLLDNKAKESFQAGCKFNSFMTLPRDYTIQFSGQYSAPGLDLQAELDASYWFDLAVRKEVLNHRGSINLRISDVFCTGGWGHTTDNEELYRVVKNHRISPMVTIGFSYKINNGLRQNGNKPVEEDDSSDGGEY